MDLQELRRVRETERETDSLQSLRPAFYSEVSDYLEQLTARRDQAAASVADPFSDPEVRQIVDELAAAERTVEALYERRIGKIVKLASFSAADMAADVDGLTREEGELFETIVDAIKNHRRDVLETLEVDTADLTRGDEREATQAEVERPESESTSGEREVDDSPAVSQPAIDRTTVRITADVGEIVGIDERSYDLHADDVVSLPTKNAEPLINRDAAEPIE